ncbi:MAG TPA: polysaccharide deacetylase family protein [Propionibacteriaceae bacterium]|nr:polysaccharide deacetylase family protein [Propionibacteriaceae bacterium]
MAVTSPPRPLRTPSTGRPGRPQHSPARPSGQLRVRWDRVAILAAILLLVVVLIVVLIVRAFTAIRADGETLAATDPIEAANPTAVMNPTAADTNPTLTETSPAPNAPAARPCPPPSAKPIYAAPAAVGGDPSVRTVALTFDDGPGDLTPQVLDILRDKQVRATFFVVGQMVIERPDTLRAIVDSSHLLGNHTWSHSTPPSSVGWKAARLTREIARTRREIVRVTGQDPCFFRPPGGVIKGAEKISRQASLSMTIWSVDTRDWSGRTPGNLKFADKIRQRARAGLKEEHPIVLMHDGGGDRASTVAALPGIIDDYRAAGYQFVDLAGNTWPVQQ